MARSSTSAAAAGLMAAFLLLPIIQARSPTYVPPPHVASCFADAHIFAAGPSELSQLIGWLTGGVTGSSRRETRRTNLQPAGWQRSHGMHLSIIEF